MKIIFAASLSGFMFLTLLSIGAGGEEWVPVKDYKGDCRITGDESDLVSVTGSGAISMQMVKISERYKLEQTTIFGYYTPSNLTCSDQPKCDVCPPVGFGHPELEESCFKNWETYGPLCDDNELHGDSCVAIPHRHGGSCTEKPGCYITYCVNRHAKTLYEWKCAIDIKEIQVGEPDSNGNIAVNAVTDPPDQAVSWKIEPDTSTGNTGSACAGITNGQSPRAVITPKPEANCGMKITAWSSERCTMDASVKIGGCEKCSEGDCKAAGSGEVSLKQ